VKDWFWALEDSQERSNPDKEKIVALCKMRGLIRDDVNETNELSEARLISAAAEGKSMAELRLLVRAGANVNGTRPDGVTAIWLAAQVRESMVDDSKSYSRSWAALLCINNPDLDFGTVWSRTVH
jgi:hypothetical protein